jgi:hypothetical protein
MQAIAELEAAARRAQETLRAALNEAERSPLTAAIEGYARAQALLLARALIAEIERQLAVGSLSLPALEPLFATALATATRSYLG